ncbi:MAG: hypothetical protein EA409_00570 [Saprospirales bacterium]|nr:MAG: hypothetical protein EA409_00570 [Saprospirales bacterium]
MPGHHSALSFNKKCFVSHSAALYLDSNLFSRSLIQFSAGSLLRNRVDIEQEMEFQLQWVNSD